MKLPPLPGRFNAPLPKRLVWFLVAPLTLCCGVGVVGAALQGGTPATPGPTWTVAPTTSSAAPAGRPVVPKPPAPTAKPQPKPPKTTPAPKTDPRFGTCREAKEHGYGPYYRGRDVEYSWYDDRDNDGVVCE